MICIPSQRTAVSMLSFLFLYSSCFSKSAQSMTRLAIFSRRHHPHSSTSTICLANQLHVVTLILGLILHRLPDPVSCPTWWFSRTVNLCATFDSKHLSCLEMWMLSSHPLTQVTFCDWFSKPILVMVSLRPSAKGHINWQFERWDASGQKRRNSFKMDEYDICNQSVRRGTIRWTKQKSDHRWNRGDVVTDESSWVTRQRLSGNKRLKKRVRRTERNRDCNELCIKADDDSGRRCVHEKSKSWIGIQFME